MACAMSGLCIRECQLYGIALAQTSVRVHKTDGHPSDDDDHKE